MVDKNTGERSDPVSLSGFNSAPWERLNDISGVQLAGTLEVPPSITAPGAIFITNNAIEKVRYSWLTGFCPGSKAQSAVLSASCVAAHRE